MFGETYITLLSQSLGVAGRAVKYLAVAASQDSREGVNRRGDGELGGILPANRQCTPAALQAGDRDTLEQGGAGSLLIAIWRTRVEAYTASVGVARSIA